MAFHKILIRADRAPEFYPFKECIKSIMTAKNHRLLFLCLEGLAVVASAALCISYSRNYISKLQKITPKIYTPVSAGQYQHGSAQWLKEKEKLKAFATMILNPKDPVFKQLIEAGKKDRKDIKKYVPKDEEEKVREHSAVYITIHGVLKKCKLFIRDKIDKAAGKLYKYFDELLEEIMRRYLPHMY